MIQMEKVEKSFGDNRVLRGMDLEIETGTSMVVIGLALDLAPGHDFNLSRDEPRLRAVFLQLLFDHAQQGVLAFLQQIGLSE